MNEVFVLFDYAMKAECDSIMKILNMTSDERRNDIENDEGCTGCRVSQDKDV
jgi:hypothetical protein